jgi:hypothetical protein
MAPDTVVVPLNRSSQNSAEARLFATCRGIAADRLEPLVQETK